MPKFKVNLCLFDLDGTIVSTTIAAESAWKELCKKHGVDPEELFKCSHGARTSEIFSKFFPSIDNTDNQAVKKLELAIAHDYLDSVGLIPGASELLLSLDKCSDPPFDNFSKRKWAIVTSGSSDLAFSWFDTILQHIGKPDVFITAFDVVKGKPDPEGYSKARDQLSKIWSLEFPEIVVFEDAPVGIKAGKEIGAITVGITSTYSKDVLFEAGADYVVSDLTNVIVERNTRDEIVLDITHALTK